MGVFETEGAATDTTGDDSVGTDASDSSDATDTGDGTDDGEPKFDLMMDDVGPEKPDESTCEAVEESLSSAGCMFAPFVGRSFWDTPWAVVAANAGDNPATVTLTSRSGTEIEVAVVQPGETHVFEFAANSAEMMDHINPQNTYIDKKAMILESDVPIVAYQFAPYAFSEVASADAAMLLPVHVWDNDHLVGFYANDGSPWLTVLSLEDDNQITVTAPDYFNGDTVVGAGLTSFTAGQSQQVTLNSQEILKIRDNWNADFTGFHVESSRPVSVSVGAPTMSIPGPNSLEWRDYLEEQVPPRAAWGTSYVGAKFHDRGGEPDLYRFVAGQDTTTITLSGGYDDVLVVDAGDFAEVSTTESFFAEGDKPFLMEHLMVSQAMTAGPKDENVYPGNGQSGNCWGSPENSHVGDPAITFVPPVEQFRFNYTFLTPATYAWDFLTVVALEDEWDLIELDGAPLPAGPTPIGNSGYAKASFAIEDGPHVIDGDAKLGIEVYGYDCHISYAYPGGLNLHKINPEG